MVGAGGVTAAEKVVTQVCGRFQLECININVCVDCLTWFVAVVGRCGGPQVSVACAAGFLPAEGGCVHV